MPRILPLARSAIAVALAAAAPFGGQTPTSVPPVLATLTVPQAVWASGEWLAAGTYDLRRAVSTDAADGTEARGQHAVELVRNGVVHGREMAMVLSPEQAARLARGVRPEAGQASIEVVRGAYVRIWINAGTMDYLVDLPLTPTEPRVREVPRP